MSVSRSRSLAGTIALAGSVVLLAVAFLVAETRTGRSSQDERPSSAVMRLVDGSSGSEGRIVDTSTVSSRQASALADGYITRAEYEAAIWDAFGCIRSKGYVPREEPHSDASGQLLQYSFVSVGDARQSEESRACLEHHSMLVEMSWAAQHKPSAAQQQAAQAAMKQCLLDAGFPADLVANAVTAQELAEYGDPAFGECGERTSQEFGIPGFGF